MGSKPWIECELISRFERQRRASWRSFFIIVGPCSTTWARVLSRSLIGWWKLRVLGWRELWRMVLIATGWRWIAQVPLLAVAGCCCVLGRLVLNIHARSGR